MAFWITLIFLVICGGLLAWEAHLQNRELIDKPIVFHSEVFQLLTMIGALGYVIFPIMIFYKFGLLASIFSLPIYLTLSFIIYLIIKGFIQYIFEIDRFDSGLNSDNVINKSNLDENKYINQTNSHENYSPKLIEEKISAPIAQKANDGSNRPIIANVSLAILIFIASKWFGTLGGIIAAIFLWAIVGFNGKFYKGSSLNLLLFSSFIFLLYAVTTNFN